MKITTYRYFNHHSLLQIFFKFVIYSPYFNWKDSSTNSIQEPSDHLALDIIKWNERGKILIIDQSVTHLYIEFKHKLCN